MEPSTETRTFSTESYGMVIGRLEITKIVKISKDGKTKKEEIVFDVIIDPGTKLDLRGSTHDNNSAKFFFNVRE